MTGQVTGVLRASIVTVALASTTVALAGVTTFNDAANFNAVLAGSIRYTEDFTGVTAGPNGQLLFGPSNGLAFVASGYDSTRLFQDLRNIPGAVSSAATNNGVIFEFSLSPSPVYAVGGNFWTGNAAGSPISSRLVVEVSGPAGSHTFNLNSASVNDYFGVVSDTPLSFIAITAFPSGGGPAPFPYADNLTVAGIIPAPGAAALLGLGGLLAARRRRV